MRISSKSSHPLPTTDSASETLADPFGTTLQALPTLAERQRAQVRTIKPEQVEGHIGGQPSAPEKIVELGSAGRIGRDHLAVENCLVEVEHGRQLVAEPVKAAHVCFGVQI